MIPLHGYDFVQWTPRSRKLYESNYLKANSPDGRRALWIKHNILAPEDPQRPAVLELWCVLFDREKGRAGGYPKVAKQLLPMGQVAVAKTSLRIEAENVLMTDKETRTEVHDPHGHDASWDIQLTSLDSAIFHLAHERLYSGPFPKKKGVTPAPRLRFDGSLTFDGEAVEIDGWVGSRGHNWGSEHAHAYAYGHCNLFEEDSGAVLDMITARLKLGPVLTPWLSIAVARENGVQHDLNLLRRSITRDAVVSFPHWEVTLRYPEKTLQARWSLEPADCVGLRYLHPDGKVSYCYNSKFARVDARLGSDTFTSRAGELEFCFTEPIAGIPLHGDAELPPRV